VLVNRYFKKTTLNERFIVALIVVALVVGISYQIKQNPRFPSFLADAKIAIELEQYPQWKYNGEKGYPQNEYGTGVNQSNYERISWLIYGAKLIPRFSMGYGLLQSSFGRLAKVDYPDSKLHQSHSGWLDLTLGLGLPGVSLILYSLLLAMRNCVLPRALFSSNTIGVPKIQPYLSLGWWALLSLVLIWCTTELSQKLYIDNLLFWIALVTGLGIGSQALKIDRIERSNKLCCRNNT
jgi:hypothetical protein